MTDTRAEIATQIPDDSPEVARFRVAAARRILHHHGCDSGIAGHVSIRAADGDSFWVSPLQYFDETLPSDVVRVGFDMSMREGTWQASGAVAFHAGIYEARPDVNSIIHFHGDATLIFSTLREPLGMYDFLAAPFYEACAILDDSIAGEAAASAAETTVHPFATALGDAKALILPNHGVIVTSDTVQHCTVEAFIFEQAARIHLAAKQFGGTEHPVEEILELKSRWGRLPIANEPWGANVRRLARSDPDLIESVDPAVVAQASWSGAAETEVVVGPQ